MCTLAVCIHGAAEHKSFFTRSLRCLAFLPWSNAFRVCTGEAITVLQWCLVREVTSRLSHFSFGCARNARLALPHKGLVKVGFRRQGPPTGSPAPERGRSRGRQRERRLADCPSPSQKTPRLFSRCSRRHGHQGPCQAGRGEMYGTNPDTHPPWSRLPSSLPQFPRHQGASRPGHQLGAVFRAPVRSVNISCPLARSERRRVWGHQRRHVERIRPM
ncbi:hypothetical protein C8F04DRAFT_269695 [Mycena alexandri]|uniref:Uncharacterized protein n=1 Tax=Mycena alexandri TaxID=1745969 RepID=A0AAD6S509_9AGAR|nr:hypothetical protein C8F04DRAFT_269695 [Mycena alexandri]